MNEKIKNLLEKFDTASNRWKTSDAEQECRKLYYKVFGKKLNSNCNNCVIDAYIEFKILLKNPNKLEQMEKSTFKLKEGSLIDTYMSSEGPQGHYTNANITDDIALALLKSNPKRIKFFVKVPADWEEQVEKFNPSSKKKDAPAKTSTSTEGITIESTLKEMQAEATKKEYPSSEWEKFRLKADLLSYLQNKELETALIAQAASGEIVTIPADAKIDLVPTSTGSELSTETSTSTEGSEEVTGEKKPDPISDEEVK